MLNPDEGERVRVCGKLLGKQCTTVRYVHSPIEKIQVGETSGGLWQQSEAHVLVLKGAFNHRVLGKF